MVTRCTFRDQNNYYTLKIKHNMLRIKPTSQQPCANLMETNKCYTFSMIYKFLKLALLLPVAIANPTCTKYLDLPLLQPLLKFRFK
jgi:hypothetical protein